MRCSKWGATFAAFRFVVEGARVAVTANELRLTVAGLFCTDFGARSPGGKDLRSGFGFRLGQSGRGRGSRRIMSLRERCRDGLRESEPAQLEQ